MSTKFTSNTFIEYPRRTVAVQMAFDKPSLVVDRKSRNILHARIQNQCQPGMCEGSVADQQTLHGRQRVDAKYTIEVSQLILSCLISHFSDICCFC